MRRPVPRPRLLFVAALVLAGVTACLELPVALPIEDQAALKCAPDDVLEDNDTPGAALQVQPGTLRGLSCRRVADSIEDRDFYRLVGAPDSLYRAWLDAPDADSVELRLFDDSTGAPVVREIDGNLRMPPSGRLLASVRLCCGAPGDSLPYDLLLSDVPNHAPLPAFDWAPATPLVGVTVTFTSLASDADGDSIAAPADKQPMQMDAIIAQAAKMLETFHGGSVATISKEMYLAFGADGESMARLVANGSALAKVVAVSYTHLTLPTSDLV